MQLLPVHRPTRTSSSLGFASNGHASAFAPIFGPAILSSPPAILVRVAGSVSLARIVLSPGLSSTAARPSSALASCCTLCPCRSGLMSEALKSANPNLHLLRVLKKYAPSTLTRYFAEWDLWCSHCRALSCCPASPPSGVLPDWLSARMSSQGLATGPVRALTWFSRVAALENLSLTLQSALVKSFLAASSPSERRESLPLPLSFVVWLERLVCLPSTPPAEVHFAGTVLVCTWSALRWGDAT